MGPATPLSLLHLLAAGEHPTTRMCLRRLLSWDVQGLSVMDYGTGSGVLAIAALLTGARIAVGGCGCCLGDAYLSMYAACGACPGVAAFLVPAIASINPTVVLDLN